MEWTAILVMQQQSDIIIIIIQHRKSIKTDKQKITTGIYPPYIG